MLRPVISAALMLTAVASAAGQAPALVVLNKGEATASLISLGDGKTLATMPVGEAPHEVAVSPDGRWAVAANYGARTPGKTLTVLDLRARRPTNTIDLGTYERPHGIAWLPDGKHVVVTSEAARAVVIVDVPGGRVERAIATGQPGHLLTLSKDGHRLWTANIATGSVSLIDLDKGAVVKTVVTGKGPEAHAVSPDGRELWAADRTLNYISILNANTLDSLGNIPSAGDLPNRLHFTPDGRTVLESNIQSGEVVFFDAKTRRAVDSLLFQVDSAHAAAGPRGRSGQPEGILISADGKTAWVALAGADKIAEIDIPTRKVRRYLVTGKQPDGMALVAR